MLDIVKALDSIPDVEKSNPKNIFDNSAIVGYCHKEEMSALKS